MTSEDIEKLIDKHKGKTHFQLLVEIEWLRRNRSHADIPMYRALDTARQELAEKDTLLTKYQTLFAHLNQQEWAQNNWHRIPKNLTNF